MFNSKIASIVSALTISTFITPFTSLQANAANLNLVEAPQINQTFLTIETPTQPAEPKKHRGIGRR